MSPRRFLRHFATVLPLLLAASFLTVIRPATKPHVRQWAISLGERARVTSPDDFNLVGVAWPKGQASPDGVMVRTSADGSRWSGWHTLEVEPEVGPDLGTREALGSRTTMPLWTSGARHVDVRFDGRRPKGAEVHTIDPGPDPAPPIASAAASPNKPGILTRADWGADESIRKGGSDYAEPLRLAIMHHTATADSYGKSESDNIVRGIYAYHVKTNGWDDIGYNFLVDRYGQIFEGRYGGMTRTVVGAHSQGFNSHSTGVAIIGNFPNNKPPADAMSATKRLLSWRLDQGTVDPTAETAYISNGSNKYPKGTKVTLKTIAAHRNVGKTACPGNAIYNSLGWFRTEAKKDGLPKLFNAKTSRPAITPNADGKADGLRLTGKFSSSVSWKVEVLGPDGDLVTKRSGFGTTLDYPWYGKDSSGSLERHGTYRYRITGKNSVGSLRTYEVPFSVWRWPNGTFFLTASKTTYILHKGYLRHPSTWQARGTRYRGEEYVSVPDTLTLAYPKSTHIGFRDGSVVNVDGKIYVISDNKLRQTSKSTLASRGYNMAAIIDTTPAAIKPHALGTKLGGLGYPNGATIKSNTGKEAWVLAGIARPFLTRNARVSWVVRDVDLAGPADETVAGGSTATPLGFRDGTLVRIADGSQIYVIADGKRRPISSASFKAMGYKSSNIRDATPAEIAFHDEGKPL